MSLMSFFRCFCQKRGNQRSFDKTLMPPMTVIQLAHIMRISRIQYMLTMMLPYAMTIPAIIVRSNYLFTSRRLVEVFRRLVLPFKHRKELSNSRQMLLFCVDQKTSSVLVKGRLLMKNNFHFIYLLVKSVVL